MAIIVKTVGLHKMRVFLDLLCDSWLPKRITVHGDSQLIISTKSLARTDITSKLENCRPRTKLSVSVEMRK